MAEDKSQVETITLNETSATPLNETTLPQQPGLIGQTIDERYAIEKAIGQLSPEHRAVILMKEIDDMQYHEIAEALECSIGTVMSRLFYARKKLQNLLRDVYENV